MSEPEYIICMDCDTPCYVFEWKNDQIRSVTCPMCGNDDPEQFVTESDLEEMG